MGKSFFDKSDAEILAGSAVFSAAISATPLVYGLSAPIAASYAALDLAYADAYGVAVNPATRTKGATAAKNDARTALKLMASDLAKIIDGTSTVTDQQRIDIGLNVRATPVPNPPPGFAPTVDLISVNGKLVRVHVHDSQSSRRAKPDGVLGLNVYSFVGSTYPPDPAQWKWEGGSSKTKVDILFDDALAAGTQVWICATWVNKTMVAGPPSVPITTHVQGGLSMVG